jgi:hypothetical protein
VRYHASCLLVLGIDFVLWCIPGALEHRGCQRYSASILIESESCGSTGSTGHYSHRNNLGVPVHDQ